MNVLGYNKLSSRSSDTEEDGKMCEYQKDCAAYKAGDCDKVDVPPTWCYEQPLKANKESVAKFRCISGL